MTTWDVTLKTTEAGTGSGIYAANATFTASGYRAAQSYTRTWDVSLKTTSWTWFTISGTAVVSREGYILQAADYAGYGLKTSNQLGYSLTSPNQEGYTLKIAGSDQTGYELGV